MRRRGIEGNAEAQKCNSVLQCKRSLVRGFAIRTSYGAVRCSAAEKLQLFLSHGWVVEVEM